MSPDILDNLLEGCQVIGFDWRYLYVNDAAARHGRRSREQLVGRSMTEAYPGIENTPMFSVLRKCMEERSHHRMENEFLFPDGSKGWFDLRFEPVPEGVFILSLEVTERKRTEEKIGHLNAVLRGIRNVNQLITREKRRDRLIQEACDLLVEARGFHSVLIGLIDGPEGTVSLHAGTGRKLDALRGALDRGELPNCVRRALESREIEATRDPDRSCAGCPCAESAGRDRDAVAIALEHEGRCYGFLLASLPAGMGADPDEQDLLREAAGDVAFALRGIEADAERGKLEEQLRLAQKLEAVGRLAGGVAHDFNNMLSAILGYCDLIRGRIAADDPNAADLGQIRKGGERAASLTRHLLAFSRKQILEPEALDLNEVVRGLEDMLRRLIGEDIDLVVAPADDLGFVKADPGQVEQVVLNLAVNARDAMPGGGKLTLETKNRELDEEYAAGRPGVAPGPYVMLAVTDTGEGMDGKTLSRIFEPFFTTKGRGKGTGLGLSTVYGIVKQSGGNIWVYSEPGKGTTFKVYLPRVEERPKESRPAGRSGLRLRGTETILVVEDEPMLRDLAARILETGGYRVLLAADGREALELCRELGDEVALVLTDVVMPNVGGRELAGHLGRLLPHVKVLYTSGYTDNAIVHHGVLDSGTPFLQKPYSVDALLSKVREVLDGGT